MQDFQAEVIAIDGPSGAGKGTVAGAVAEHLGWRRLDSGALYRVVGLVASRRGIDFGAAALAAMARDLDIAFTGDAVIVDGADETRAIRAPGIDAAASRVAAVAALRTALLDVQRRFRRPPGLVAEGRDMGTTVFPDATLKIFLTASAEARAERRHRQLRILNDGCAGVSLAAIFKAIEERDTRDRNRAASPLVPALDAVAVDSTGMSISEVVATILSARSRLAEEAADLT